MTWLKIVMLALQLVTGLVAFLQRRQWLKAGEARAIAEALEATNERVKAARKARERANNSDPDPDDPYLRD